MCTGHRPNPVIRRLPAVRRRSRSADPSTRDFAAANLDVSLAIINAGQSIASAVEKCYRTTGFAVFIPDSPIQRAWRDIATAIQHIAFNTRSYGRIGRELTKLRSL